jgi:hypothetical protein
MSGRNRTIAILSALGVIALAVAFAQRGQGEPGLASVDYEGTVRCRGSIVELDFDPESRTEVRTRGRIVAAARVGSRKLARECTKVPIQQAWSQAGIRYTWTKKPTKLTCRLPGRFFVHTQPVSPSWAGERQAGSAVSVVLGRRVRPGPGPQRTILASASVVRRPSESTLAFAAGYCAVSLDEAPMNR